MERIGVIGLGRMGSAIAQRMAAEDRSVRGWTRSGRAVADVQASPDLETLIAASDTLILSLYDDAAVAEVLETLLTCDLTDKQIIDTSTVIPDVLKSRIDRITAAGASAVDAPISGGPEMVHAGTCGIFIGGDDTAAARAQRSLSAISGRMFHVGPLGTGLVMKVINNGMIQAYFNALGDMMPLAKRAGLPLETALNILGGGPAGMPMLTSRIPKVLGTDTQVGFTITAVQKDNDVFQRVVASFGLDAPFLAQSAAQQQRAVENGIGECDPAALISTAYENG